MTTQTSKRNLGQPWIFISKQVTVKQSCRPAYT